MKPSAQSIAELIFTFPPHIVASQLNILIPVGTAIAIVATAKIEFATGPRPTVNMWCAQTMNPKKAINIVAKTIAVYPNSLFLENVANTSLKIPNTGKIKMYTSGCPNIQNRCCQIIVFPPKDTSKKAVPNIRSNINKNKLIVNAGKANKIKTLVINVVHENNGIRI